MIQYGEAVRTCGAIPLVPGNDFLSGLVSGELKYDDYISASLGLLDSADAMLLVPGWEGSKGALQEIAYAKAHNIPVIGCLDSLTMFLERPKILCIIGESGTGKSMVAEHIEKELDVIMIKSHTTRPPRYDGENTHTFHDSFDHFYKEDMIAYTKWEGYEYCCLHSDVNPLNTYVIDESGYSMLKTKYGYRYNIRSIRIHRDEQLRVESVGLERVQRDEGKFRLYSGDFDCVIENNSTKEYVLSEAVRFAKHFFTGGNVF